MIATVALLPAYLWSDGRGAGLPIVPLHTMTILWTYALPLIAGHPEIANYDADEIFFAATCAALYSGSATAVWLFVTTRPFVRRARHYVLPENRGFTFFIVGIVLGGLFIAAAVGQLISLEPGIFGIVRSSTLAFASIAIFILSARMGRGELNRVQCIVFLGALVLYLTVQLTTVFLAGAIISVASALIGFTIGRGRVPWATIVSALLIFGFLHSGKTEMRERYWYGDSQTIEIFEIPAFFGQWLVAGIRELGSPEEGLGHQPIHERVSLLHILLLAQRAAPQFVPHLNGETYSIIPRLLVPRIFDPDKPDSHQGTSMLNLHFGIQSIEDTERTTIGWGLLNEAYANFGLGGVVGIACVLSLMFSLVGRLTVGAPLMSLENMIGVTFAAASIQSEFTMAVLATVLFQSLIVLMLVVPLLKKQRAGSAD